MVKNLGESTPHPNAVELCHGEIRVFESAETAELARQIEGFLRLKPEDIGEAETQAASLALIDLETLLEKKLLPECGGIVSHHTDAQYAVDRLEVLFGEIY